MSTLLKEDMVEISIKQQEVDYALYELKLAQKEAVNPKNQELAMNHEKKVQDLKVNWDNEKRNLRSMMTEARRRRSEWDSSIAGTSFDQMRDTSSTPTSSERELKLVPPLSFSGEMEKYAAWRFDCLQVIKSRPVTISSDEKKISFFRSIMDGVAKSWFKLWITKREQAVMIPASQASQEELAIRHDIFQAFLNDLDRKFKDPLEGANARNWVDRCQQGNLPFDEYVTKFETNLAKAGLVPDHFVMRFINSLNGNIRKEWIPRGGIPSTFVATVEEISIQTNSILRAPTSMPRTHNTLQQPSRNSINSGGNQTTTRSQSNTKGNVWQDSTKPGPFAANPGTATYQLRKKIGVPAGNPISNKTHYEKGKSLMERYLKEAGQDGTILPRLNVMDNIRAEIIDTVGNEIEWPDPSALNVGNSSINKSYNYFDGLSSLNEVIRPYSPHFMIPFYISSPVLPEKVLGKALVDSGATRTYISRQFAVRNSIKLIPLATPQQVLLADGGRSHPITHKTETMTLTLNDHSELLSVGVFDTKQYDLILGLNWLTYHSPSIDWELRTIKFNSYICRNPRIPHQIPDPDTSSLSTTLHVNPISPPAISEDERQQLPSEQWPMSDYEELFNEDHFRKLPPLRPGYDFDPKLKDNAPAPKNRSLFRLPRAQVEATEKFISAELKEGKLEPSKSPLAANLYFVTKNDSNQELRPCIDYRDLNS
ncbi:hypothetical protein SeLEV6574_g07093, partial [Synchytrium endobioticum]